MNLTCAARSFNPTLRQGGSDGPRVESRLQQVSEFPDTAAGDEPSEIARGFGRGRYGAVPSSASTSIFANWRAFVPLDHSITISKNDFTRLHVLRGHARLATGLQNAIVVKQNSPCWRRSARRC